MGSSARLGGRHLFSLFFCLAIATTRVAPKAKLAIMEIALVALALTACASRESARTAIVLGARAATVVAAVLGIASMMVAVDSALTRQATAPTAPTQSLRLQLL